MLTQSSELEKFQKLTENLKMGSKCSIYLLHLKENYLIFDSVTHSFWFLFIYPSIQQYKSSLAEKSDPCQKECLLPFNFSIIV